jgi:hypothetical protein
VVVIVIVVSIAVIVVILVIQGISTLVCDEINKVLLDNNVNRGSSTYRYASLSSTIAAKLPEGKLVPAPTLFDPAHLAWIGGALFAAIPVSYTSNSIFIVYYVNNHLEYVGKSEAVCNTGSCSAGCFTNERRRE